MIKHKDPQVWFKAYLSTKTASRLEPSPMKKLSVAEDRPIFQVVEINSDGIGRQFSIWADGRTEGFDFRHIVINLIPAMANQQMASVVEKAEQGFSGRRAALKYLRDLVFRMVRRQGKTSEDSRLTAGSKA